MTKKERTVGELSDFELAVLRRTCRVRIVYEEENAERTYPYPIPEWAWGDPKVLYEKLVAECDRRNLQDEETCAIEWVGI